MMIVNNSGTTTFSHTTPSPTKFSYSTCFLDQISSIRIIRKVRNQVIFLRFTEGVKGTEGLFFIPSVPFSSTYPVSQQLQPAGKKSKGETIYQLDMDSTQTGLQHFKVRVFPYHSLLSHRFEMGCMIWL